jgi:dTDP-4-amino-4,6-dideoxygalactose transaminase
MHLQPIFQDCPVYGGPVSEALFQDGLCLPSGTVLADTDITRIVSLIEECAIK